MSNPPDKYQGWFKEYVGILNVNTWFFVIILVNQGWTRDAVEVVSIALFLLTLSEFAFGSPLLKKASDYIVSQDRINSHLQYDTSVFLVMVALGYGWIAVIFQIHALLTYSLATRERKRRKLCE